MAALEGGKGGMDTNNINSKEQGAPWVLLAEYIHSSRFLLRVLRKSAGSDYSEMTVSIGAHARKGRLYMMKIQNLVRTG